MPDSAKAAVGSKHRGQAAVERTFRTVTRAAVIYDCSNQSTEGVRSSMSVSARSDCYTRRIDRPRGAACASNAGSATLICRQLVADADRTADTAKQGTAS